MKYAISYKVGRLPKHVRYYDALNEATALEMFNATCEESLAGEKPQNVMVKRILVTKGKNS